MTSPISRGNVSFPSRYEEIQAVEDQILSTARDAGFDEPACFAVKLALEEALTNAIKHGNQLDETKQVHVTFEVDDKQLKVQVRDEGPGFKPSDVPDPTLSENLEKPSGRGLMLIRAYMTDVYYDEAGSCVTMIKTRECPLPEPPAEGG